MWRYLAFDGHVVDNSTGRCNSNDSIDDQSVHNTRITLQCVTLYCDVIHVLYHNVSHCDTIQGEYKVNTMTSDTRRSATIDIATTLTNHITYVLPKTRPLGVTSFVADSSLPMGLASVNLMQLYETNASSVVAAGRGHAARAVLCRGRHSEGRKYGILKFG